MRRILPISLILLSATTLFAAQAGFNSTDKIWTLKSDRISAVFQLTPEGYFLIRCTTDLQTGDVWKPPVGQSVSPIGFTAGADTFDSSRQFTLVDQYIQSLAPSGVRQYVVLQDMTGVAQITVMLEVYDGQPVLRYSTRYRNTGGVPIFVTAANMLPWNFDDLGKRYTTLVVNQWSTENLPEDFEQSQLLLATDGTAIAVQSGAGEKHSGWLAIHDSDTRGLFAGWEFDGVAKTTVRQFGDSGSLQFSSTLLNLNHPVLPSATFDVPTAFVGFFHGDFDEAGYRTQRFAEAVLAKKPPAGFPYVSWDSWAYTDQINQQTLMQNADLAASVGAELFVVDLGWARALGDWYADDTKFPDGLKAVSNHVHDLGMKFGLHFALTEADPNSPVVQANPDWTTSVPSGYFGSVSLCLSNQPTRDWVIQQAIRMIDDYGVDWFLQDSADIVKLCTKTTHTHDPADSNYSNAVDGLNYVVSAVQAARPNVLWENCENGGSMMTFNMVKNYVTSINNDASGALESRRAAYGATFPFSPRYAERYMPDSDGLSRYALNSYRFGGPWVLMNQLGALSTDDLTLLASQVQLYKNGRASITNGKVFHILPPAQNATDAIQSYDPDQDCATAVITRAQSQWPWYNFHPRGLNPASQYTVTFEVSPTTYSMTGAQLMSTGVHVPLPMQYSSEVVHIDHQ